jgi:hypothetical protein
MPARSKISLLPEPVKADLDRRLIEGSFSGYRELEEWLEGLGFEISHTAINRYGRKFEKQLEDLKVAAGQSKAIVETLGDDANSLGDAVTQLALQKALVALQQIDPESIDPESKYPYEWTKVLNAIGKLSSQAIANQQHRAKIATELKAIEVAAKSNSQDSEALMLAALEKVRRLHGIT